MSRNWKGFQRRLIEWKVFLILFLTPILYCPLPLLVKTQESKAAYCILIMATYWCTEVTDLAVTALLPLFLFPVLGVMKAKETAPQYFKDTNVLILGGLIMAVAIEQWNVHKRIALRVLLVVGVQPRRLMLGFMVVTAFISMWITNTATTAMMTPIMEAVLKQLDKESLQEHIEEESQGMDNAGTIRDEKIGWERMQSQTSNEAHELKPMGHNVEKGDIIKSPDGVDHEVIIELEGTTASTEDIIKDQKSDKQRSYDSMCKAMMMSICYSANIGGTGTLTGTLPQLVLAGQIHEIFKGKAEMSFFSWFVFSFPGMVLFLIIAWLYLQALFFGIRWKHICFLCRWKQRNTTKGKAIYGIIKKQYDDLGPMSFAEKSVLGHFIILVLFWIFRDPKFIDGWGSAFLKGYVSDATAAILIAFSLFIFPSDWPRAIKRIFGKRNSVDINGEIETHRPLLKWKEVSVKFPWNVIILLGSGFALARACEVSGLSIWLGCQLTSLKSIPNYAIVLIICVMITFLTEFTSNTATATILLPVLASLGQSIQVNPLYLMIPATVCSSFAFMLPVATPPNAIVFATGRLTVPDMMKAGFGMNIIGIICVTLAINTWGAAYFDLRTFPSWAATAAGANKCFTNATITT